MGSDFGPMLFIFNFNLLLELLVARCQKGM